MASGRFWPEARGNVSCTVWYDKYLSNIAKSVASMNGKLDPTSTQTKHTEYSRVILALTALGEDATKFTGSNGHGLQSCRTAV